MTGSSCGLASAARVSGETLSIVPKLRTSIFETLPALQRVASLSDLQIQEKKYPGARPAGDCSVPDSGDDFPIQTRKPRARHLFQPSGSPYRQFFGGS
jgi:hypothetical protein